MTSVDIEPIDPTWCYEFVPSSALPVVDLSMSIKSRFLPESALRFVDRALRRFQAVLTLGCVVGMVLSTLIACLSAPIARVSAIVVFITTLPLYLAGFSSLRFEMVCLVIRDDSAIFFWSMNALTNLFYGILLGDIRALVACVNLVGWSNVVFIDTLLRGIRRFTILTVFALAGAVLWLIFLLLNRIDEPHGTSLWQYEDGDTVYDVSAIDYVINGFSTLIVLLIKIIYRKRKSIRASTRNSVIECVVLRCRMKLIQLSNLDSMAQSRSSVDSSSTKPFKNHMQRLQFVRSGIIYDARKIMFPVRISCMDPFPLTYCVFLYSFGCAGFSTLMLSSYYVNRPRSRSLDSLQVTQLNSGVTSVATFFTIGCSISFWLVFIACYQRNLLKSLFLTFDFAFYSTQSAVTLLVAASMYNWERNYCLWLVTCWGWMQWIFCLDALTPVAKCKLRFRLRYAIPVAIVLFIGIVLILFGITAVGMNPSQGHAIWSSVLGGRNVTIQVLPFFASRLFTMAAWILRVLVRLCKSSDADAIILRGAVRYNNYLSMKSLQFNRRVPSLSGKRTSNRVEPSSRQSLNITVNPVRQF